MAAAVTSGKTVLNDSAPHLTAAILTTVLAIAPENMTVSQYKTIGDALDRHAGGKEPTSVIGNILV